MRSRFVRLAIGSLALLAFGGSAFLIVESDRQIAVLQAEMRAFDAGARETRDVLADLRAAQQAYVAAGQGRDFWIPKVQTARESAVAKSADLRNGALSGAARAALDRAVDALAEFDAVDLRAREYLAAGQELMAADVVFTEGGAAAAAAATAVEEARSAEQAGLDAAEAEVRTQQRLTAAGGALIGAFVIVLLAATGASRTDAIDPVELDAAAGLGLSATDLPAARPEGDTARANTATRGETPLLKSAAELCTDFGRVRDVDDLSSLLGRAATIMDASGLVVWMGDTSGGDLRPVLAHGYPPQALSRMPAVPRGANNAAAAAYRSGGLQIVLSKPGETAGAIVAPLLAPEGCFGALSIEIKSGGETSDAVQALAGIFAAQLSGGLASAAAAPSSEQRAALG